MREFINHVILSSYFIILIQGNLMRSEDISANMSFALTNETMTNILKSKVVLSDTGGEDIVNLYSNSTDVPEEDYVEFSLLHPDKARDLFRIAKKKNVMAEMEFNKTLGRQGRQSYWIPPEEAYHHNPFFISKAMDLMTQSVYSTRYRLRETRDIRRKFSASPTYKLALMYGSLMQLRLKIDNLYATMKNFHHHDTKFIWYLVLYERCLSFSVDISQLVKDMFQTHAQITQTDKHITGHAHESNEQGPILRQGPPGGPPLPEL